ncbi:WD40-repeat-containing domain protein, partial [Suillus americanus]
VAFFNDSRRVVTGSSDSTLRIWDAETGASVGGPFEPEGLSRGTLRSLAVSPDDRLIASAGSHGIIIWDIERMEMCYELGSLNSACFSSDGKRLAGGGESDDEVTIWDSRTCNVLASYERRHRRNNLPAPGVLGVAFNPDGLKLACGSSGGYIDIRRTDNLRRLFRFNHGTVLCRPVRGIVWSPDGQQLVSISYNELMFWNSSNGHQIGQPSTGHTRYINSLAISSDGSFIATASSDQTVRLWCAETHQQIGEALKHTVVATCVAISPNAELLVSGGNDGQVRVWMVE